MNKRQLQISKELGVSPTITPAEEIEKRSRFLANYLEKTNLKGFVLGISGGQDSLLAGILAKRAVEYRRKAGYEASFHAVLLPYGTQADRADAELAIATIGPDVVHEINIKAGVDAIVRAFSLGGQPPVSDYDKGNIKARVRMIAQYGLAHPHGLAVIGTDHAAEAVTGFFTKFGDGGADIVPLAGLTKRQGRAMLEALGVPEVFITKAPTADLLDNNPGQADESELGLSYQTIDDYLEGKLVPNTVAAKIEARYDATQHKRDLPVAYRAA